MVRNIFINVTQLAKLYIKQNNFTISYYKLLIIGTNSPHSKMTSLINKYKIKLHAKVNISNISKSTGTYTDLQ